MRGIAKQALQDAPKAKALNLVVFDVIDAEEVSYDAKTQKRICAATAFLNSGKRSVRYTMEWVTKPEGARRVWLTIQLIQPGGLSE